MTENSQADVVSAGGQMNLPPDQKISFGVFLFLFIRQFFAAFFNYTNLGVVFSRSARQWLGPSRPEFMPFPYFLIGFLCSLFAVFMDDYAKPTLCAQLTFVLYLIFTGCNSFRGFGVILSAFALRRLDTYVKAVVVLIMAAIFTTTFEFYLSELKPDLMFCIGFGIMIMLSALCATSINYGCNDDPVSSYGSLSLMGLIIIVIIGTAVTFTLLNFWVALSMIGICAFTRLVLGQYIYVKNISASCDVVCGVQIVTMLLLMLDLLFVSHSFEFLNSNVFPFAK